MKSFLIASLTLLIVGGCRTIGSGSAGESESELRANSNQAITFGELAQERVFKSYQTLAENVGRLSKDSLPHEGKALRKDLDLARDMLDIFAPVMPGTEKNDFFLALRENLDMGYESVGFFKDLYDVQGVASPDEAVYDQGEVKEFLKPVLDWKESFLDKDFQRASQTFFETIDADHVYKRKSKDLSKFYWRNIENLPSFGDPAGDSLIRLIKGLLKQARAEEDQLLEIKSVVDKDDQEVFHDFRKRVRTVVEVSEYFSELFDPSEIQKAKLVVLTELVARYGALHDKMISYDRALEKDKKSKAKELAREIDADWQDIKKWQKDAVELKL